MNKKSGWIIAIVVMSLSCCFIGVVFMGVVGAIDKQSSNGFKFKGAGARLGVIEIKGQISDSKHTLKEIHEFDEDKNIKAVVLRIDSPGGSVGPSQEIYDAVRNLKKNKPVVVSMGSLCASGGYYIASAANKIYANAGTLTGSIGVIMQMPNVEGLMKWAGVSMNTITAGKMKDTGNMFRPMRDDERQYLTSMLADVHLQFIEAVAVGRNLKVEEVTPLADGRVYSGRQAKGLKLVDELGGIDAAIADAAKLGGIKGKPILDYPAKPKKFLQELMGGAEDDEESSTLVDRLVTQLKAKAQSPGIEFRWSPGE